MPKKDFALKPTRISIREPKVAPGVTIRRHRAVPDSLSLSERPSSVSNRRTVPVKRVRRAVVGTSDERLRVPQPAVFPFSAICHLLTLDAAGNVIAQGTGWLASANTVITAAHVVAPIVGGIPTRVHAIRVIPGRNEASAPFGAPVSSAVAFAPGWGTAASDENDFGAIRIGTFNGTPGSFASGVFSNADIPNLVVNLTGYPALPPQNAPQGTQWGVSGSVALKTGAPEILEYSIDMTLGQSGSPLLVKAGAQVLAAGINTGFAGLNRGVRMTSAVANQIAQWVQAAAL